MSRLFKTLTAAILCGALAAGASMLANRAEAEAYADQVSLRVRATSWWYGWVGNITRGTTVAEGFYSFDAVAQFGITNYSEWYAVYVYDGETGETDFNYYFAER